MAAAAADMAVAAAGRTVGVAKERAVARVGVGKGAITVAAGAKGKVAERAREAREEAAWTTGRSLCPL